MSERILRCFSFSLLLTTFYSLIFLSASVPSYDEILEMANKDNDQIVKQYGYLHQHPELFFREFETSKYIKQCLEESGIEYSGGWGTDPGFPEMEKTGIIADIGTGHAPCIALRADIDALPLQELVDFEYKSLYDGKMHACGHDTHAAMLLGAARILKQHEDKINGTVRLVWQPAEEGGGGGCTMIQDGVFEKYPPVQNSFGMHVYSKFPTGSIFSGPGALLAAANDFYITITGKGGHAAMHHFAVDPITAGTALVRAMYDMYARERYFQTDYAGLVSVTYFESSSNATNVIPDTVTIGGTLRAMKTSTLKEMEKRVKEMTHKIASSYRCTATITNQMRMAYPATFNNKTMFELLENSLASHVPGGVQIMEPNMGGEDYSFFLEAAPGCFFFIGSGSGDEVPGQAPTNADHHSGHFHVDKRVLPLGATAYAHLAFQDIEWLNSQSSS